MSLGGVDASLPATRRAQTRRTETSLGGACRRTDSGPEPGLIEHRDARNGMVVGRGRRYVISRWRVKIIPAIPSATQ